MKKIVLIILTMFLMLHSCKDNELSKKNIEPNDPEHFFDSILEYDNQTNDSIRKTLGINDIIVIKSYSPVWEENKGRYDTKISIAHNIVRIGNDERRTVDAVEFDLVIIDRFENELYRVENLVYEENLEAANFGSNYSLGGLKTAGIQYNKRNNPILEKLRMYQSKELKTKAEIKVILYTDGKVLKAK